MIAHALQRLVRRIDSAVARLYLAASPERPGLLTFLFHSLFRDPAQIAFNLIDPLDRTTVDHLRRLIEYYQAHGYRFIGLPELQAGLPADGRYALLTFDDGYFNNTAALPLLERYRVPAVFFISTDNVRHNKCFWWDVLYRELCGRGVPPTAIHAEALSLKSRTTEEIESALAERFGHFAFTPRCDIDRPFSPHELRAFAAHPFVHIGNHTANHAILTNYAPPLVREQISKAQQFLFETTGSEPAAIAYPNGAYSPQVLATAAQLNLAIGFTTEPAKTRLPVPSDPPNRLRLGRFVPHAETPLLEQCRTYRSDLLAYSTLRRHFLRLVRRPGSPTA